MTWLFIYFIVLICSQQLSLFVLSLIISLNCHTFNNHIMILSAQITVKKMYKWIEWKHHRLNMFYLLKWIVKKLQKFERLYDKFIICSNFNKIILKYFEPRIITSIYYLKILFKKHEIKVLHFIIKSYTWLKILK